MRDTVLLLLAAAAAFGGALWAPFHLDDLALLNDPAVTSPSGWLDCFRLGQTRPLTWLTFWINYQIGETNPSGYHSVNLLLHLASIAVLRSTGAGLVAAGVFALHPIQTEAVVYVFARATLLMTFFCLLSLRAWKAGREWEAVAWFLPAVLAKEECVTFPLFLLLVDRTRWRACGAMLAASFAAGLRVLLVAGSTAGSGAGAQATVSPLDYFWTQGTALFRYARLLLLPFGFTPESPLGVAEPWIGAACWAAIAAAAWYYRPLRGMLILLLPSSSILPADDLSADRRLYLPLIAQSVPWPRWLPAVLAALSFYQTWLWIHPEKLWRQAIDLAPGKLRPYIQLARTQPPTEAISTLQQAAKIAPADPRPASELGRAYLDSNQPAIALAEFGRALALAPNDPSAINNRGVALWRMEQIDAAKADFRRALALDPCHRDARANLERLGEPVPKPATCP